MVVATRDTPIGHELPSITRALTQEKIDAFEGQLRFRVPWERFKNPIDIHTDEALAKQKGFPTTIGHGLHLLSWISEMLTKFLGEGWVRGGKISMNFIAIFIQGDVITARGVVREKVPEGSKVRVVVDVWCDNQHGEKVSVGIASGLVD